ncbi:hypothetical protein GCM10022254_09160 [Actinomadura meridiana]|uniref:YspA cpYpsA-related SLOG domain-containing protein n=1 Tax=Actinomadura meridiana TaxID=559626 RepID=A0ABP8BUD6_9ACTN
MRILVTGSRAWDDAATIRTALDEVYFSSTCTMPVTVVHGDCPHGADAIVHAWAADTRRAEWVVGEERHPADWRPGGGAFDRSAGHRRNAEMVNAGADLCLAFIRDRSSGATHTADLAERAGIPVRRWTS